MIRSPKTAIKAFALILAVFAFCGAVAPAAHALTSADLGIYYGGYTGLTGTDIRITIANIVRIALGFLGILAVLLILYAGFLWMTAGGETDRIDRAKKTLTAAVIGLIIILAAFAIVSFIIGRLTEIGGGGGGGGSALTESQCIGLTATCPAGPLGNGIIESHYPGRNASNIPRNTRIAVTFKRAILPASVVVGGPNATVAIIKSAQVNNAGNSFTAKFAQSLTSADIDVSTLDNKTFVFIQKNCSASTPQNCIGSPSENVFYTVALRGAGGIKLADGTDAFTGQFSSGYLWEFQVSTTLDLTPPQVTLIEPGTSPPDEPRNTLVQADFNEPIDPLSIGGVTVAQANGTVVRGQNAIGNGYRTIEFHTDDLCGTNSCGESVYCLPANANIRATVKADDLSSAPPTGLYPPDGITDMAGNSLDGNKDGTAQGPPTDSVVREFSTNDAIDLTPPKIVSMAPAAATQVTGNVDRGMPITATFSKLMSAVSFTSGSARLVPGSGGAPTNFWVTTQNVSSVSGAAPDRTQGSINHDLMSTNQYYAADFNSGLRDLQQNCYYPGAGQTVCSSATRYCCNGTPSNTPCAFAP